MSHSRSTRVLLGVISFLALSTVGWGEGRTPASLSGTPKAPLATKHALQTTDSKHLNEVFVNVVTGTRKQLSAGSHTQAQLNLTSQKPASVVMLTDEKMSTTLPASPGRSLASAPANAPRSAIPWATGGVPLR